MTLIREVWQIRQLMASAGPRQPWGALRRVQLQRILPSGRASTIGSAYAPNDQTSSVANAHR